MNLKTILIGSMVIFGAGKTSAQDVELNMRMIKPFVADGNSNEWNEPLNQYNSDTKLAFALANDDENLYIIIESLDPATTQNFLFGGITININTVGKKKNGTKLTFPFHHRQEMLPPEKDGQKPPSDFHHQQGKENPHASGVPPIEAQGIKLVGFKNIKDTIITAGNDFGIQCGMSVKKNQDLIYEIAIPLTELQVNPDWKKAIAYNIKLNTVKGPRSELGKGMQQGGGKRGGGGGMGGPGGGGGGMGMNGGMGGGGPRGDGGQRTPLGDEDSDNKKSDFWIKYKFVKA